MPRRTFFIEGIVTIAAAKNRRQLLSARPARREAQNRPAAAHFSSGQPASAGFSYRVADVVAARASAPSPTNLMRTTIRKTLSLLLLLLASDRPASAAAVQEPDSRVQADGKGWRLDQARRVDPHRPRVLLIGDSILNGYLKGVTAALEGTAYVDAWVNPYHQASGGLDQKIAEVLAHGPYAVIHFNMGLHGWQPGRIPAGQFEALTRRLVQNLRQAAPQAKLVWASSTPVTTKGQPGLLDSTINPTIVEHNRLAEQVMRELGVPSNDLYGLLAPSLELARGDQFHWTAPAYARLASAVAAAVTPRLP
jgi:hypothetical protein